MLSTPPGAPVRSLEILVVDDDVSIRALVLEILTSEGHQVHSTESARNALALMRRRKFHIVISDICMPHMDGLELTRQIHQAFPAIRVILMSGYYSGRSQAEMDQLNIEGFISKPFRCATIVAAVNAIGPSLADLSKTDG